MTSTEPRALRMRDLTADAGLSRQAIHFYIEEGLLPPPRKKGRNTAQYTQEHLERLRWIQRLQQEHFLSLSAIKAVFDGEDSDGFTPQQRTLLRRVREQLPGWARSTAVTAARTKEIASGLSETELAELAAAGLIEFHGRGVARTLSQDDADIVECYARYKQAGATPERGYRPAHIAIMDKAIGHMVEEIAHVYARNWANGPAHDAVAFLEAVIPIDERLMATLLRKKMRTLISGISGTPPEPPKRQANRRRTR